MLMIYVDVNACRHCLLFLPLYTSSSGCLPSQQRDAANLQWLVDANPNATVLTPSGWEQHLVQVLQTEMIFPCSFSLEGM